MTMADEPADDDAIADVFSTDRDGRGGKEPPVSDAPATSERSRDERGRFAATADTKPQPDAEPPPVAAQPAAVDEPAPAIEQPNVQRHSIPLSEHLGERKKYQSRIDEESRARIEAETRAKTLEQMLQRAPQPVHQQRAEPVEVPDALVDPQGYVDHVLGEYAQQQRVQILNVYEERVRDKFGDDKVDAAFKDAEQTGMLERIKRVPNPWAALMRWHKEHQAKHEIGDDLEAFKKRIADEAVQNALAALKNGGAPGGQAPAQPQAFPGSLATATATGTQGAHLTDEAAAQSIFGSDRRRRRTA
jgi:hypothetical protein